MSLELYFILLLLALFGWAQDRMHYPPGKVWQSDTEDDEPKKTAAPFPEPR